jgi:hypothetical protein
MDKALLQILQHSLGVDQYGQGQQYRNYFVAGGKDVEKCRALVAMGFMKETGNGPITGNEPCFCVTREGKAAMSEASPKPPKVARSKQRYQDYLRVADCFESFHGYLSYLSRTSREQPYKLNPNPDLPRTNKKEGIS